MFRTTVTGGQLVYNCRLPATSCFLQHVLARVVELVDAGDSKSPAARRAGSSPASGTIIFKSPPTYSVAATAATAATRPAGTPRIALRWQAMFDAAGDARRELSDFSHTCARSRTGSPVPRSQRPFRSIPSKQRKSDPAQQKAQHYDTKVEYWNDQEHQS